MHTWGKHSSLNLLTALPPRPKHTILDNIVGNKMHFCSLFFVFFLFPFDSAASKPTPSLLINIGKSRSAGVKVWRSRSADVRVWRSRSAGVRVWRSRSAGVKVWRSRSAGVKVWRSRSAGVKVCRCRSADVKVWRCSITAAFLRRTLRRRSREKQRSFWFVMFGMFQHPFLGGHVKWPVKMGINRYEP